MAKAKPGSGSRHHVFRGKEYVYVPAGPFIMGSTERRVRELGQADSRGGEAFEIECPQHPVDLAGYYIARYPVTNAEYQVFLKAAGHPVPYQDDEWSKPYRWDPVT